MSVNKVILVGRLGRDPETRYTSGGGAVCNFSLAVDEVSKGEKTVTWFRIACFGKQAEIAQQYLTKGSLVFVDGRLSIREYQGREGDKKTSVEVLCNNFRMLGGGEKSKAAGEMEHTMPDIADDESIPF